MPLQREAKSKGARGRQEDEGVNEPECFWGHFGVALQVLWDHFAHFGFTLVISGLFYNNFLPFSEVTNFSNGFLTIL